MIPFMAPKTTVALPTLRKARPGVPLIQRVFSGTAGALDEPPRQLRATETEVGRGVDPSLGIGLPHDEAASRRHACFTWDAKNRILRIRDLGSRNGIRVNGELLAEATIDHGDVVQIANSFLVVHFGRPEPDDAPNKLLLGSPMAMGGLRAGIARVARAEVSVLLLGESGTGKELAARSIHQASGRRGPFIAVNCSALPEHLVESQLFGHRAGAFTGANKEHEGFFRAADGGTIFLDEIGDLPLAQQPKLLRVLEENMVMPVGSTRPVRFDARVVAATNAKLSETIRGGSFRGDLYARLAEVTLHLPPLRQRRGDILQLLYAFLGKRVDLDPVLVEALLLHPWPFNVRELRRLATDLLLSRGVHPSLTLDLVAERLEASRAAWEVPTNLRAEQQGPSRLSTPGDKPPASSEVATRQPAPGREQLEDLLRSHRGNLSSIARAVGRSRMQVYRWIERHGLTPEHYREG